MRERNMVDYAQRLHRLTTEQLEELESADLERLEAYMEERDKLFLLIQQHDWRDEELLAAEPALREVVEATPLLIERMQQLQAEAGTHLGRIAASRKQTSSYQPSYGQDSLFFEKKR